MKVIKLKPIFEPIKIEIHIESEDEFSTLKEFTQMNVTSVNSVFHDGYKKSIATKFMGDIFDAL